MDFLYSLTSLMELSPEEVEVCFSLKKMTGSQFCEWKELKCADEGFPKTAEFHGWKCCLSAFNNEFNLIMKGAPCPSNSPAWTAQQHPRTTESLNFSKIVLISNNNCSSDTFCSFVLQTWFLLKGRCLIPTCYQRFVGPKFSMQPEKFSFLLCVLPALKSD